LQGACVVAVVRKSKPTGVPQLVRVFSDHIAQERFFRPKESILCGGLRPIWPAHLIVKYCVAIVVIAVCQ
jgi:hypothetical protein